MQNHIIEEEVHKSTNGDEVENKIVEHDQIESTKIDESSTENKSRIPLHSKKDHCEQDNFNDCSVKVLGLEVTSTCDVNKPWSRPHTPVVSTD